MKNVKDITVIIIDSGGNYIAMAQRMARDCKKVYYCTNWQTAFPRWNSFAIGLNVPSIERVDHWSEVIDTCDLICFPDLYFGALQEWLVGKGYTVFGTRLGETMEIYRDEFKEMLKDAGLPVNKHEIVYGFDDLKKYLYKNEDKYVKTSIIRGNGETFHWIDRRLSESRLDELQHSLGAFKEEAVFVVEEPISDAVEIGIDELVVNGMYPDKTLLGIEVKDCYDNQTEVLTDSGWKLFKNLNKTEKVLTLNISDGRHIKYEYQKPVHYIERNYNGDLVSIEKDSVSLCITPTHNVLHQKGVQNPNAEVVSWNAFGKNKVYDCVKTFKRSKQVLKLTPIINLIQDNKRFSLFQPKGSYTSNNPSKDRIKIGNHEIHKIHMARLLGLYLSEGCLKKTHYGTVNKYSYTITVAQFKHVSLFEEMLKKTPFKWTRVKSGFNCYDKSLGDYLFQFGKAREKFVPQWIKESGQKIINAFLDAYCLGDGSFTKKYKKIRKDSPIYNENYTHKVLTSRYFYTCSKMMADDLQELLVKVGSVAVSRIDKEYFHGKEQRWYPMYSVQEKLINRKNYVFPKDINYVEYNDKVYCVTVPNGIIMVRRNGKSMWCGNCGYCGLITEYANVPDVLKNINKKLSGIFAGAGYKCFFSNEVRWTGNKGYFIDACCRVPSPPGDLQMEIYKDYSRYIWEVANGIVPEIEATKKFGAQIIIKSDWATDEPQAVYFPDKYKERIKIKNLMYKDDTPYYIPGSTSMSEIGSVVGLGNTMDEAIADAKKIAETVQGDCVSCNGEALDKAMEEFKKLDDYGIKII